MEKIYTVEEVCELLKIGKTLCYRYLKANTLNGKKLGKKWIIPESSLSEYLSRK